MHVCLLMPCGHLLGKCWPLGSCLWCLIVTLSLSHWYPGSGVVLDVSIPDFCPLYYHYYRQRLSPVRSEQQMLHWSLTNANSRRQCPDLSSGLSVAYLHSNSVNTHGSLLQGGGGVLSFFLLSRLGPITYYSPQNNIRNFKHPQNIFEILATPKKYPQLYALKKT